MSVDARQELDLNFGVAFSRLMTRAYLDLAKEKFRIRDLKVISFGLCQTPTLWFFVQRHREIQAFRPEEYFLVSVRVNIGGCDFVLEYAENEGKVTSRQELGRLEAAVRQCRTGVITGGEEGGQEAAGSEHGDPAQGLQQGPGHVAHSGHARGRAPLHLGLHLLPQVHYNDTYVKYS